MDQPVSQLAVVGHDEQSTAVFVESPDGEQPGAVGRKQVDHSGAAAGIVVGAQVTGWFVQQEVRGPLGANRLPVNDDFLDRTIDTISQVARTGPEGSIGDGKIFVLPMHEVHQIGGKAQGQEAI